MGVGLVVTQLGSLSVLATCCIIRTVCHALSERNLVTAKLYLYLFLKGFL